MLKYLGKTAAIAALSVCAAGAAHAATVTPTSLFDGVTVVTATTTEDDSGLLNEANWFIFETTVGANVDIDINRLVADPDLIAVLFLGDVTGVDFGDEVPDTALGAASIGGLTQIDVQDDTEDDAFGGSFGDPRFTFTAATTGTYSVLVTQLTPIDEVDFPFDITATGIEGLVAVPLPAALPMFAFGVAAFGLVGARRRFKTAA